jgi:thiamine biosynthesis lipoprotein ApbE
MKIGPPLRPTPPDGGPPACNRTRPRAVHGTNNNLGILFVIRYRSALADPRQPENLATTFDLRDSSLCTSGGYGTKCEPSGKFHHLFDTATGPSARHYVAVSVFASSAMIADAPSTALYVTPPERGLKMLANYEGVSALVTLLDGTARHLSAARTRLPG